MPKSAIPNFIISISKILIQQIKKIIFQYTFEALIPIKFHFVTNIQIYMSIYNSIPFPETKMIHIIFIYIPVVPARGGAEVALKIYIRPFSSIELACAVRQRSPCMRAFCEIGILFHMSHLKLRVTLHT